MTRFNTLKIAAVFCSAALLLPSCMKEETPTVQEGDDLIDIEASAQPAGIMNVNIDPAGNVLSTEYLDNRTRSDYTGSVKELKTTVWGLYNEEDGKFVQQSYNGRFSKVSRRKTYTFFCVANVPDFDFRSLATIDDVKSATFTLPSYSKMNSTLMPHAGMESGVNFTNEPKTWKVDVTVYRLFTALFVDYTLPADYEYLPTDVVLDSLYIINQNKVLMPFGESYYHAGESGCEKFDDPDKVVGKSITPGSSADDVIYLPENMNTVSDHAKTSTQFVFKMSYKINGIAKTHRVIGAPHYYSTDGKKHEDQVKRNMVITIKAFSLIKGDMDAVTVDEWGGTDVYVGQHEEVTGQIIIPSKNTDDIIITITGDGAENIGDTTWIHVKDSTYSFEVPYDAVKGKDVTVTVKYGDKEVVNKTFTPKKPLLKFVAATYELKNNDSGASDATPYALKYYTSDGAHEMSLTASDSKYKFDKDVYNNYLVPSAVQNPSSTSKIKSQLEGFKAQSLSGSFQFKNKAFITDTYSGTFANELKATAKGGDDSALPAYAAVKISGSSIVISPIEGTYTDPGIYVAQYKNDVTFKIYNPLKKTLNVASADGEKLSAVKVGQTQDGNNTIVTVKVGGLYAGNHTFTVSDDKTTLPYTVTVNAPVLKWDSNSYTFYLADNVDTSKDIKEVSASWSYYKTDETTKMASSAFDATLYVSILKPSVSFDNDDTDYFVDWDAKNSKIKLANIFFQEDAADYSGKGNIVVAPAKDCGVAEGKASIIFSNGRTVEGDAGSGDWQKSN